jgi:hypothetical protein
MDNISTALEQACIMHDYGCLPAVYPRTAAQVHSGFYADATQSYCPPQFFCDGRDTSADCSIYGAIELAWRLYIICSGPTATENSTWGDIKGMYR